MSTAPKIGATKLIRTQSGALPVSGDWGIGDSGRGRMFGLARKTTHGTERPHIHNASPISSQVGTVAGFGAGPTSRPASRPAS